MEPAVQVLAAPAHINGIHPFQTPCIIEIEANILVGWVTEKIDEFEW